MDMSRASLAKLRWTLAPFVSMWAMAVAGCGDGSSSVHGTAQLIDRTSAALTSTSVMAIEGTYGAGCTAHAGSWAIALNGYQFVGGETQLTVVENDVGCVLSVTGVKAGAVSTSQLFVPAVPFSLTASFAPLGVSFLLNSAGATQFYANLKVTPDLTFNADFIVQMVYSDNSSETDLSANANWIVETATATATAVAAPNATLAMDALKFSVDAHKVVKTSSGSVMLTQGTVIGASYVIESTLGKSPSYASVDTAFNLGGNARVPLVGASQAIPAAALTLVGLDLSTPKQRNIIVAHIENGVNSYLVFEITFLSP